MPTKAKRRKNWKDGCTVAQKHHLRDSKIVTKAEFVAARAHQEAKDIPCHDCRSIAIRIGVES